MLWYSLVLKFALKIKAWWWIKLKLHSILYFWNFHTNQTKKIDMLFSECLENVRFVADSHSKLAKIVKRTQCFKFVHRGFKHVQQKICVVFRRLRVCPLVNIITWLKCRFSNEFNNSIFPVLLLPWLCGLEGPGLAETRKNQMMSSFL